MSSNDSDDIEKMLADGWSVAGFSVYMLAAGATCHNVLLQKGTSLRSYGVLVSGGKELVRGSTVISPPPVQQPKKGFFG